MTDDHKRSPSGPFFWISAFAGWGVLAFGIWTLLHNSRLTDPFYTLKLAVGTNIVHDAIVAPTACVVGVLVAKFVPGRIRAHIGWGLAASAIVVAVGYAPLRGYGRKADNTSVLPLNYATAVLTVLAVVWVIVLLSTAVTLIRARGRQV